MKFVRFIAVLVVFLTGSLGLAAQSYTLSGTVTDKKTSAPVEFATVMLESSAQWAVADAKGNFTIKNVHPGKTVMTVSCLGYVNYSLEISISKDVSLKIQLDADNLALETAVVTAQDKANSATTSRLIDKTALDHVQMMNITDVASLMPGGATSNPSLIGDHNFAIRSGGTGEAGNALFGAAIEVDGARLSNNGSFEGASLNSTSVKGVSTNNIASSNVESIEVISGVASVEYGDMASGVVKVNTIKGKTPYTITASTTPGNKQVSFSKGFALHSRKKGRSYGFLNTNLEYTRSISEPMSPYTSYDRKQINLTYSNTFAGGALESAPLKFSVGVTGNLGSMDSKTDPDRYKDDYTKSLDNALRGNISLEWLLNRSWITNLEFKASASYSDKSSESKTNRDNAVTTIAVHGMQNGYFMSEPYREGEVQDVVQIKPGYYSNVMNYSDKPLYVKASLKANWARNFGKVNNKVKLGTDFSADKNLGTGQYSNEMATAPSFREYRYCDVPAMYNAAVYLEDNLTIEAGRQGKINLIAGIRNDNTIINGSAYGTTSSWSPRFNAKYTILDPKGRSRKTVRSLSVRAGWGKAVKLPSFGILYPSPSYYDIEVFRSTVASDNSLSSAYYIMPQSIEYNPDLKWQYNLQTELGVDINIAGTKIGLSGYYTTTHNAYRLVPEYETFSYNYTPVSAVQGCTIPAQDRIYSISRDGVINIADKTGTLPGQTAAYTTRKQFMPKVMISNDGNPVQRYGLEWTVEFPKINPINTTIMLDGNFYGYKSIITDITANCPYGQTGADGQLFRYKAYYYGRNQQSNGSKTMSVRNNLTVVTRIPKVRMVISVKLEASLYKYSQALSERLDGKNRSWSLKDKGNPLSVDDRSIYNGDNYVVLYPDYVEDLEGNRFDFLDKFRWAKENDPAMYSDLSRLVSTTNYTYTFKSDNISPYLSANISVTKEIGDIASISFYANNFFNNMGQVYSTKTGNWSSVTNLIPSFYYGLTLRLKF